MKALTAFPQVLAEMDRNMRWTTDLGNAYYNQPQDIIQAVQVMRQRAQAAGNLQTTPQETVSYDQGNIEVAPANPQVVYVPAYNPWVVYGQPISPYPGFSLLGAIGSFVGGLKRGLGCGLRRIAGVVWIGHLNDSLQPHSLWLYRVGLKLAALGGALPSIELLYAQHHGG